MKVLIHDDDCGAPLHEGFCPVCKFVPDMQSTAFAEWPPQERKAPTMENKRELASKLAPMAVENLDRAGALTVFLKDDTRNPVDRGALQGIAEAIAEGQAVINMYREAPAVLEAVAPAPADAYAPGSDDGSAAELAGEALDAYEDALRTICERLRIPKEKAETIEDACDWIGANFVRSELDEASGDINPENRFMVSVRAGGAVSVGRALVDLKPDDVANACAWMYILSGLNLPTLRAYIQAAANT